MSEKKPIRLFVTHTFQDSEDYARVFEYLESRDNFFYTNYSDPASKPDMGDQEALEEAIRQQIKLVEVVIFPVAMHHENPKLIEFELKVAKACKLPILGIEAFGSTITVPLDLLEKATETVGWNDREIIDLVQKLARGESDAKWDVIEFDMD
jgi:hypothetical protein